LYFAYFVKHFKYFVTVMAVPNKSSIVGA